MLLAGPVKRAIETLVDRAYYRDRFDHRRALVRFARDLNADLDLERLSERLVSQVSQSLGVDRMALLLSRGLPSEAAAPTGDFRPIRWIGLDRPLPLLLRDSAIGRSPPGPAHRAARRPGHDPEVPRTRRWPRGGIRGLYYFVPCIAEGATIAAMALGAQGERRAASAATTSPCSARRPARWRWRSRTVVCTASCSRRRASWTACGSSAKRIVDSLSDGLVVLDDDDRVVRWNTRIEDLYGVSRGTAVGARIDDLFAMDFVRRLRQARAETPTRGVLYRVPLLSRHDPPRPLLVNAATAPLQAPQGGQDGTTVIVEDITLARAASRKQLQISEKMASIGLLAAGVAHEVNTPLTGISSFTQMLLDGAGPRRSTHPTSGEDRAAVVPGGQDRQRAVEPGPAPRTRRAPST